MNGDPFSKFSTFHQQNSIPTLDSVLGDEAQLAKALAVYNSNTPSGQQTILIPAENKHGEATSFERDETSYNHLTNSGDSYDPYIEKYLRHKYECRGYIRVIMNLRRPINVLPGTRPPSTYTITISTKGKALQKLQKILYQLY